MAGVVLTVLPDGVFWMVALPVTVVEPPGEVVTEVLSVVVPGVTVVVLPEGVLTVVELAGVLVVVTWRSHPVVATQASAMAAKSGSELFMSSPN